MRMLLKPWLFYLINFGETMYVFVFVDIDMSVATVEIHAE